MKIKEAVYKKVRRTTRVLVKDEVYGCDHCRKAINLGLSDGGKHRAHLEVTVFSHQHEATRMQFCSWKCCLRGLREVKTDYFISLPYLLYDEEQKGIRAQDFFAALEKSGG